MSSTVRSSGSYDVTVTSHVHDVILGTVPKDATSVNTDSAQTPPVKRRQQTQNDAPVIQSSMLTSQTSAHASQTSSLPSQTISVQRKEPTTVHQTWLNRAEEIIKSEIGAPEYNKRLERQNTLFQKGCKKGGFTDFFSLFLLSNKVKSHFASRTKDSKKRSMFGDGIGALGYAIIEPDARIPNNEFFKVGGLHEVRARFSNSPWSEDDRRMGYRSMSLKFADHPRDSPFDLVLQTGYLSPFFNGESIEDHMVAMEKRGEHVKKYLLSLPIYMQAVIEGFRKRPDSYHHQHYHSQMVFDFHAADGKARVGRMRVVPADGSGESGRLTYQQQRDAWFFMLIDKQEQDVSPNYLKIEMAERLRAAPVVFKLQIQLHDIGTEDDHMVYNASIPWDSNEHPWMTLATIHLNELLPSDVIESTRFNVGNLPVETLSFPEATSVDDFNIVPNLRAEVYEYCQKQCPVLEAGSGLENLDHETEYLIHVVTGSEPGAGNTDSKCNIYVSIVGTEGRTSFLKLERRTRNDFAEAAQATFCLVNKNVGDFVCLKIHKDRRGSKTDWLCDYVIFTTPYNNRCYKLPAHSWFTDDTPSHTLRTGQASLENDERNSYLVLTRSLEVAGKRQQFQWHAKESDDVDEFHDFPGSVVIGPNVTDVPHELRLPDQKGAESEWSKHVAASSSFFRTIKNMFKSRGGSIQDEYMEEVTSQFGKDLPDSLQYVVNHWRDDAEFSRQLINMMAPDKIEILRELPDSFPVSDVMLEGILDPETSLQNEIDAGNVFILTFPELEEFSQYDVTEEQVRELEAAQTRLAEDNVSLAGSVDVNLDSIDLNTSDSQAKGKTKTDKKTKPKPPKGLRKYLCAPQVLFLKSDGALLPLAIQLFQQPPAYQLPSDSIKPAPVIYTMNDSGGDYSDWLVAKMWVKVACAHVQHLTAHLLNTHLLLEPIAISVLRNLPVVHPVYKLLAPHLRHVIAINAIYRKYVMPNNQSLSEILAIGQDKGHLLEFVRQQYGKFRFSSLSLPNSFKERGFDDAESLPSYLYREDSLRLWNVLRDYCNDILSMYYNDDVSVSRDDELATVLSDLRRNGYHRHSDIPERFGGVDELVDFACDVMYRASVQHSVTCSSMLDVYTFAPNAPLAMMRPPPQVKRGSRGWDQEAVRFMLPPPDLVERCIDTMNLLNTNHQPAVPLRGFSQHLFTEERAQNALRRLRAALELSDKAIHERNKNLDVAYEYFLTKNIAATLCN